MLARRDLLPAIARGVLALPDRMAHGLLIRDLDAWLRFEFLGVMARSGLADAMAEPGTLEELASRAGTVDASMLEAVLELGVALGEVATRDGRYRVRGRRLRAVAGRSADLRGLVEEVVVFDNVVYSAVDAHLRGLPAQPYDAECGEVIAAASRVAAPVLGPAVEAVVRAVRPSRILDIGCGSGIYLHRALAAAPSATGVGLDRNETALADAAVLLAATTGSGRAEVRRGDFEELAAELGEFDLVLLMNNIYYWRPEDRAGTLRGVRASTARGGTVVVATATPNRLPVNRHLDLVLRATSSSHRLPTRDELADDLRAAGFVDVAVVEPVPGSGLVVATGRRP